MNIIILLLLISQPVFAETINLTDRKAPIDYCQHPDCSMKNQHTLCATKDKWSGRLFASGATSWMRYQLLLLHNRHRDTVALGLEAGQPPAANMRKLYWDEELERSADAWARQCRTRHDECRHTIRHTAAQNIDVRPVVAWMTEAQLLTDAVAAWFSGSRALSPDRVWSFRLANCSAPGGCLANRYSAAAWGSTWRIGCSQALCTARRRSCVQHRKRRDSENITSEASTESTSEKLVRRTSLSTSPAPLLVEEFAAPRGAGSPIHRGEARRSEQKSRRRDMSMLAYTVCNYGPAGNVEGFPMYEPGLACHGCPAGTVCADKTHRALCALSNDPDLRQPPKP